MSRDHPGVGSAPETRTLQWVVVGAGVAGRARAKAIAADPRARLAGVWRGRFAEEIGAPVLPSLEQALAVADAVAICSPTPAHAEQIEAALGAGRHVLVEFPLAQSALVAEKLLQKARAASLVLHEEHIELLDATTSTLAAHIRPAIVRSVTVAFEGPGQQDAGPGELALSNVARLHRVAAFAGPFVAVERVEHEPGKLSARLLLESGGSVHAIFQQAPYFQRRTTIDADTVAGRWTQQDDQLLREGMPVTLVGSGGLFARDQKVCTARILDGAEHYVSEARILHVMEVVDQLSVLRTGPVRTR
jgi:biliverdin reductase